MSIAQFSADGKGFGATALAQARAAGLSDQQIRQQVAAAGLTLGPSAAQALGVSSGGGGGGGSAPNAASSAANAPFQALGGVTLDQFAGAGGTFGLTAMQRAQQAGLSSDQIKARLAGSGLTIGGEVQKQLGIGANGYPSDIKTDFVDAGSGASYNTRGIATKTHGVVYAAGPATANQIRSFLAGEPEENWDLPASAAGPGQPYQAPGGSPYVKPTGVGPRPQIASPQAATQGQGSENSASSLLADYQRQLDAVKGNYESSLKQLEADRESAKARTEAYEQERKLGNQWEINLQLQGLRSGSTVGGTPGAGLGSLSSGRSSTFRSGNQDTSSLTTYLRNQALNDSVLNRKGPVVETMTSGSGSGTSEARQRSLSGGSAGYYARRFG